MEMIPYFAILGAVIAFVLFAALRKPRRNGLS